MKTYKSSIALKHHAEAYDKVMRDLIEQSKGKFIQPDGDILIHPQHGPSGFVKPMQEHVDSGALMSIEHAVPNGYVFNIHQGETPQAARDLVQSFSDMLAAILLEHNAVGVFNLPVWLASKLKVNPKTEEDMRFIIEVAPEGEVPAVYIEFGGEVHPEDATLSALGFEPTNTTLEEVEAANNAKRGDSAATARDEVDVVVKRKGE